MCEPSKPKNQHSVGKRGAKPGIRLKFSPRVGEFNPLNIKLFYNLLYHCLKRGD